VDTPTLFVTGDRNHVFGDANVRCHQLLSQRAPELYELAVLPGYGHLDPIIGKDADRDVFPTFVDFLKRRSGPLDDRSGFLEDGGGSLERRSGLLEDDVAFRKRGSGWHECRAGRRGGGRLRIRWFGRRVPAGRWQKLGWPQPTVWVWLGSA
jgi:hypothetical protein